MAITFLAKSTRPINIKCLFECLKYIVKEANLIIDSTGIRIQEINTGKNTIVYCKLHSDKFEEFKCTVPKVIGVSVVQIFKLIKGFNQNDTISFYMEESEPDKLGINLEDMVKKKKKIFKLPLLDREVADVGSIEKIKENIDYPHLIRITPNDFQQIIRDFDTNDTKLLEISSCNQCLTFTNKDASQLVDMQIEMCHNEKAMTEDIVEKGSIIYSKHNQDIIQGVYDLYMLLNFTKATPLTYEVRIHIANENPILIEYDVSNLGHISFLLKEHGA